MTVSLLARRAAALLAALSIMGMAAAQAKQACSTAAPPHGYWSWRLIDGRKCWYEGRPGLSKSLLEWPARGPAPAAGESETASAAPEQPGDPLDAQASVRTDSSTFDALWRSRIENR